MFFGQFLKGTPKEPFWGGRRSVSSFGEEKERLAKGGTSFLAGWKGKLDHTHGQLLGDSAAWLWENQWYHSGVGAPPILVYFDGDWDVHSGYGIFDPWPY